MFSTSSVNVIGFDPNRSHGRRAGALTSAAADVREASVEGPAARQHRPSSCLRQQVLLQAREVVRLKLSGFANALVPAICFAALVLHGDHGAEDRRQRSESIEEVAHGTDRRLANGLESTPQFPFCAEYKGGCVHTAHVCPRFRCWICFVAHSGAFGEVP